MKKKSYFENFKTNRKTIKQKLAELEKDKGFIPKEDVTTDAGTYLWECGSGHKFRATLRFLRKQPKCMECLNAEHNVTISIAMIKQILESMTGKSFNEFHVINPNTKRQIGIHGYSPDLKLAFQFIGPQDHVYIKGIHKNTDELMARKELIAKKKEIVEDIPAKMIQVYYELPREKLQAFLEKNLDEMGIEIISREEVKLQ